jgi:orotidine-5'-phosphate decarboxylase
MAQCDVILALDLPDRNSALEFLKPLAGELKWVKVGLQMYLRYGRAWVEELGGMGFSIFLDLKLHDIPNTVAKAVESLRDLPVGLLTLHASGGRTMMEAAHSAAASWSRPPALLGVTVLTSMDAEDCRSVGWGTEPAEQVDRLARLAAESGLEGIVCSPLELGRLKAVLPDSFLRVVPGIRPAGVGTDEQKRVMTPVEAVAAGASYLVVGRPLLKATDPVQVLQQIRRECGTGGLLS